MVKPSRVLAEAEAEAEVRYEETRLARRATRARPRLALLLALGAAGFGVEAALARAPGMGLGAITLAASAWGVRSGRLGGIVAASLAAVLATLIPLALLLMDERVLGEKLAMVFVILWGIVMLPDALTLIRDAELQHAYGRWARREA